jgi:uncharacterized membrane protein YeaQ/YmgE (transglycosylase-associated protein family)
MPDFWNAAKGTLATVAPMLASAVGGPLAGAATGAVIKALGMAPDTAPDVVAQAVVNATPDQLLALKKADQEFAEQMKALDLEADKLVFADKANAREREVEISKTPAPFRDHTPSILAYSLTAGFFGLLITMMFHAIPDGMETLMNIMLGALGSSFGMAVSYYFGSSNKQSPIVTPEKQ